ncbi:MAG: succinate dehydrogenase [Candidatus Hydrogenedentota bacterium]|nr:MAG: succinate dehydrogenase [Candidatus Hydrogenedentota bacterium]GIX44382.1 MAG: succinate dehydrogenase [Candidatus Sumerlaea sp.]
MSDAKVTYSEFVLRRLHSLTGVIPLTFFIFFHFFANSYSTKGPEAFNATVATLRGLPYLHAIEWGLLFAPFLFHMIYGLWVVYTGKPNPLRYKYPRNWAYLFQRVTAIVLFVFILYHVISLRFMDYRAINPATGKLDFYNHLHHEFQNPLIYWWYVVGIACTAFHLANGLCTFCMTWGITVGRTSQRYFAYAMTGLGILLFVVGVSAIHGFLNPPKDAVKTAQEVSVQAATVQNP